MYKYISFFTRVETTAAIHLKCHSHSSSTLARTFIEIKDGFFFCTANHLAKF